MENDAAAAIQTAVSISHLLQLSSPLSGAASLRSSSSPPPFPLKKLKTLTNPNPTSLPHSTRPLLLVGAVHLPSPQSPCKNHCFAFSDASSRVCCSLLDLHDLSFISNEIHVLAWNFIPSSHNNGGGILEIIRWILPPSETPPRPLPAHHFTAVGALRCASTIFAVPCRNPGGDSFGFLAEVITCNGNLKESKFVYFLQPSSKWRPVVGKLIGKWVSISGLKKKLISVGENEKYEMLVTTEVSAVSLCRVPVGGVGIWKEMCGGDKVYNGVVTGVYMHGMAVELDEKVWLLVTDPRVAPPHSIRVGAIISVRNFHLVRPKFSWIQIHLIGTCARTNIDVKSFSLPDTRSYVRTDSGSMLGKFIESLTLSAKFWLLLLVSCFRRKFAKIFSDKEILGSKHMFTEGRVGPGLC